MANIPKTMSELLDWAPLHAVQWLDHAEALGLNPSSVEQFAQEVEAFKLRKAQSSMAHNAAASATLRLNEQEQAVRHLAGLLVRQIKTHAETVADPALIPLALLRPDSPPTTLPAPATPSSFTWSMNSSGELTIKWKVRQPRGVQNVIYRVRRALNFGPFELLDTVGSQKRYTDAAIPAGTRTVAYIIEPMRGNVRGPVSPRFTISLGSDSVAAAPQLSQAA